MFHVSGDAAAVIAQIVAVLVFASVVELRRAFFAQSYWEMRILLGVIFVLGVLISGGTLVGLIAITARGGIDISSDDSLEAWIIGSFGGPLLVLVAASMLRGIGADMGGRTEPRSGMTWFIPEIVSVVRNRGGAPTKSKKRKSKE